MKQLLLALGLVALTLASAHAQGTFNPVNGPTSRVRVALLNGTIRNLEASDGDIKIGVFIGAPGEQATARVGTMSIGATAGLMVGLPTLFAPVADGIDTQVGSQISLRYAVVDTLAWCGDTGSRTITLAPAAGPGTVVWSSTATSTRFAGLLVYQCPEPSTLALGAMGGLMLLFRLRKSSK